MIGTSAHLVVVANDIRAPMQAILDAPLHADALIHALRVGDWSAPPETAQDRPVC